MSSPVADSKNNTGSHSGTKSFEDAIASLHAASNDDDINNNPEDDGDDDDVDDSKNNQEKDQHPTTINNDDDDNDDLAKNSSKVKINEPEEAEKQEEGAVVETAAHDDDNHKNEDGKPTSYLHVGRRVIINVFENACYILDRDNKLRQICIEIIDHWFYDAVLIFLIALTVVLYVIDTPVARTLPGAADFAYWTEIVIQILYTIEMLIKIAAMGFALHPYSYLRDPLRIMEFLIVGFGFAAIPLDGGWKTMRNLKLIRLVHALERLMKYVPELRGVFEAMRSAGGKLRDLSIMYVVIAFAMSILGLQIFNGAFQQRCFVARNTTDPASGSDFAVLDPRTPNLCTIKLETGGAHCLAGAVCGTNSSVYVDAYTNFDHIGNAFFQVFKLTTLANWQEEVKKMQFSFGSYAALYPLVIVFVLAFGIMNFFVAILSVEYEVASERHFEDEDQTFFEQLLFNQHTAKLPKQFFDASCIFPTIRYEFYTRIVNTKPFRTMSIVITLINIISLATYAHDLPSLAVDVCQWINFLCGVYFVVEAVLRVFCLLGLFFRSFINIFDFILAVLAVLELAFFGHESLGSVFASFRGLRALSIFRLAIQFERARQLLVTISYATRTAFLMFLLILAYVVVGGIFAVYLFRDAVKTTTRPNFSDLRESILAMFIILTGENWVTTAKEAMTGTANGLTGAFFCLFYFVGTYLLLNFFLVIVITCYSRAAKQFDYAHMNKKIQAALALDQENAAGGAGEDQVDEDGFVNVSKPTTEGGEGSEDAAMNQPRRSRRGSAADGSGDGKLHPVIIDVGEEEPSSKEGGGGGANEPIGLVPASRANAGLTAEEVQRRAMADVMMIDKSGTSNEPFDDNDDDDVNDNNNNNNNNNNKQEDTPADDNKTKEKAEAEEKKESNNTNQQEGEDNKKLSKTVKFEDVDDVISGHVPRFAPSSTTSSSNLNNSDNKPSAAAAAASSTSSSVIIDGDTNNNTTTTQKSNNEEDAASATNKSVASSSSSWWGAIGNFFSSGVQKAKEAVSAVAAAVTSPKASSGSGGGGSSTSSRPKPPPRASVVFDELNDTLKFAPGAFDNIESSSDDDEDDDDVEMSAFNEEDKFAVSRSNFGSSTFLSGGGMSFGDTDTTSGGTDYGDTLLAILASSPNLAGVIDEEAARRIFEEQQQQQQEAAGTEGEDATASTTTADGQKRKRLPPPPRRKPADGGGLDGDEIIRKALGAWHKLARFIGIEYTKVHDADDCVKRGGCEPFCMWWCDGEMWCGLRHKVATLVFHPAFDILSFLVVLDSLIALGFESDAAVNATADPSRTRAALEINTIVITVWFCLEVALKIFALSPEVYFAEAWNAYDTIVAILTIISNVVPQMNFVRSLWIVRLVQKWHPQKMVLTSLAYALPGIFNVVLLLVVTLFTFSILGVHLFAGQFARCNDRSIINRANCTGTYTVTKNYLSESVSAADLPAQIAALPISTTGVPRRWEHAFFNYNNIGEGIVSCFVLLWGDGWSGLLYDGMDSSGVDTAMTQGWRPEAVVFFVAFVFIGNFVVKNLFVSSVLDSFATQRLRDLGYLDKYKRRLLTPAQEQWIRNYRFARTVDVTPSAPPPENPVRRFCCWVYFADYGREQVRPEFEYAVVAAILINVAFMATEFAGMPNYWSTALFAENLTFVCLFVVEIIITLGALMPLKFFRDPWHLFNLTIVACAFLEMFLPGVASDVFLVVRVLRILRVIRRSPGLYRFFEAIVFALPQIANVTVTLVLVLYIFGATATALFQHLYIDESVRDGTAVFTRFFNFRHAGFSMLTLLQSVTTAGWSVTMRAIHEMSPSNSGCTDAKGDCGSAAAIPFFLIFMTCAQSIFLNLYIFVMVDNFLEMNKLNDVEAQWLFAQLKDFRNLWAHVDPNGNMLVPWSTFVTVMQRLAGDERECAKSMRAALDAPSRIVRGSDGSLQVKPLVEGGEKHSAEGLEAEMRALYEPELDDAMEAMPLTRAQKKIAFNVFSAFGAVDLDVTLGATDLLDRTLTEAEKAAHFDSEQKRRERKLFRRIRAMAIPVIPTPIGAIVSFNDCLFGFTRSHAGVAAKQLSKKAKRVIARLKHKSDETAFKVHHAMAAHKLLTILRRRVQLRKEGKLPDTLRGNSASSLSGAAAAALALTLAVEDVDNVRQEKEQTEGVVNNQAASPPVTPAFSPAFPVASSASSPSSPTKSATAKKVPPASPPSSKTKPSSSSSQQPSAATAEESSSSNSKDKDTAATTKAAAAATAATSTSVSATDTTKSAAPPLPTSELKNSFAQPEEKPSKKLQSPTSNDTDSSSNKATTKPAEASGEEQEKSSLWGAVGGFFSSAATKGAAAVGSAVVAVKDAAAAKREEMQRKREREDFAKTEQEARSELAADHKEELEKRAGALRSERDAIKKKESDERTRKQALETLKKNEREAAAAAEEAKRKKAAQLQREKEEEEEEKQQQQQRAKKKAEEEKQQQQAKKKAEEEKQQQQAKKKAAEEKLQQQQQQQQQQAKNKSSSPPTASLNSKSVTTTSASAAASSSLSLPTFLAPSSPTGRDDDSPRQQQQQQQIGKVTGFFREMNRELIPSSPSPSSSSSSVGLWICGNKGWARVLTPSHVLAIPVSSKPLRWRNVCGNSCSAGGGDSPLQQQQSFVPLYSEPTSDPAKIIGKIKPGVSVVATGRLFVANVHRLASSSSDDEENEGSTSSSPPAAEKGQQQQTFMEGTMKFGKQTKTVFVATGDPATERLLLCPELELSDKKADLPLEWKVIDASQDLCRVEDASKPLPAGASVVGIMTEDEAASASAKKSDGDDNDRASSSLKLLVPPFDPIEDADGEVYVVVYGHIFSSSSSHNLTKFSSLAVTIVTCKSEWIAWDNAVIKWDVDSKRLLGAPPEFRETGEPTSSSSSSAAPQIQIVQNMSSTIPKPPPFVSQRPLCVARVGALKANAAAGIVKRAKISVVALEEEQEGESAVGGSKPADDGSSKKEQHAREHVDKKKEILRQNRNFAETFCSSIVTSVATEWCPPGPKLDVGYLLQLLK